MRSSIAARTGAVVTATALALTLGVGSASAADPKSTAAKAAPTQKHVSKFHLKSGVITQHTRSGVYGDVLLKGPGKVKSIKTEVRINGVRKGTVKLYTGSYKKSRSGKIKGGGVDLPRRWGAGAVVLGPTTFTYSNGATTVDQKKSNRFYIRRDVKTLKSNNTALVIKRTNKKVTFKVQRVSIVKPSSGKYVSAGSVKLQYKSSTGKWKTKKTIKLNSKGNGTYKRTTSAKQRYRIHVSKTDTRVQFRTRPSGRI
ncbi:hypothetical protein [Aeromicrobium chenweiae]|uniref:Uncharacterized protein n=1 Tax=Aeromicrobium chenweiae TaxID=2079793 RepID=A0A2S0WQQ8_9ACTN|nr:hypothetical protein [Aeromicrobium chenweiae]AWB93661.1 hypothetical protein C3E78_16375 [Aeromicrobium chenweiae]TGN30490.1 hypothetical protein E4L97_17620 [Aeromicrobium chenweiae]